MEQGAGEALQSNPPGPLKEQPKQKIIYRDCYFCCLSEQKYDYDYTVSSVSWDWKMDLGGKVWLIPYASTLNAKRCQRRLCPPKLYWAIFL